MCLCVCVCFKVCVCVCVCVCAERETETETETETEWRQPLYDNDINHGKIITFDFSLVVVCYFSKFSRKALRTERRHHKKSPNFLGQIQAKILRILATILPSFGFGAEHWVYTAGGTFKKSPKFLG